MRIAVLLFLAGAAVAQAPAFKPKPVGTLKQVMRGILLPASDALFAVQDKAPANDAEWAVLENYGIAIAEAATLINMPGRLRSNGQPVPIHNADWVKFSDGLVAAGQAAYKAALTKKQDTVAGVADQLSEACANCHDVYRDAPQDQNQQKK